MKKIAIISLLVISVFHLSAQDDASIPGSSSAKKESGDTKFFITLTAGPALTMGDFADTDNLNEEAGGALPGIYFGLDAGYIIKNGFGLALNISSGSHFIDEDWWGTDQGGYIYTNLLVGPMITTQQGNLMIEGHILGGATNLTNYDDFFEFDFYGSGFGLMVGGNLKLNLNRFLLTGGFDYLTSNPYFSDLDYSQPMGALILKAGIGYAF